MKDQNQLANHRRVRLLHWMDKYQINRTEMAKRLGVGRAYMSLLLIERPDGAVQKTRHFGEKAARSIEESLGMARGYLDSDEGAAASSIGVWQTPEQLPTGCYALVPRCQVSMVGGQVTTETLDLPNLAFTRDWLIRHKVTSQANLRTLEVRGDAMHDYLHDGDLVMLDVGQVAIEDRVPYVIEFADELRIRRLEKLFDGSMRVLADNPVYKVEELSPEQSRALKVVGRVLWRAG